MSEEKEEQSRDYYYEPKETANVLINVINENTSKMLHAHGDIIKTASTVFTEMLMSATSMELEFTDADPNSFIQFLAMLYPRKYDLDTA